jgi:hypothetical protein
MEDSDDQETHLRGLTAFGPLGAYRVAGVRGLMVRVGKRAVTFYLERDTHIRGARARAHTMTVLGSFIPEKTKTEPRFGVKEAKRAAEAALSDLAQRKRMPGRRSARKFLTAWEKYLDHLQAKADEKGKPARWKYNVERLGEAIILPKFENWTLTDMSDEPDEVERWHRKATKDHGKVSADHCARIVRAVYRRSLRGDPSLPPARPTSLVELPEVKRSGNIRDPAPEVRRVARGVGAYRVADQTILPSGQLADGDAAGRTGDAQARGHSTIGARFYSAARQERRRHSRYSECADCPGAALRLGERGGPSCISRLLQQSGSGWPAISRHGLAPHLSHDRRG